MAGRRKRKKTPAKPSERPSWVERVIDWKPPAPLERLGPVGAALRCARDTDLIDDERLQELVEILRLPPETLPDESTSRRRPGAGASRSVADRRSSANAPPPTERFADAEINFETLVAPEDTLVADAERVATLPERVLVAFIDVDEPTASEKRRAERAGEEPKGRRRLLHLMLSLGGGRAIGYGTRRAIKAGDDRWTPIDLSERAHWLPPVASNGFDDVNAAPIEGKTSRPVRVRYVRAHAPSWDRPIADDAITARIAALAAATPPPRIRGADDRPGHVRLELSFPIERDLYHHLFNSPDGMRGHYYAAAETGDAYVRTLLERIAGRIDLGTATPVGNAEPRDAQRQRFEASIVAGKAWTIEKATHFAPWPKSPGLGLKYYPRNARWTPERAGANAKAFTGEVSPNARLNGELDKKVNSDGLMPNRGATYFTSYEERPLLDVKGTWIAPDGTLNDFVPPTKEFRSHQIKWFGYT